MSKDFFRNIEVKVPHRSGEDLSFQHTFTGKVGTLIPSCWQEVIPGTKVYLKAALAASMPPLASDTFMKCRIKNEAFFVPFRQLSAGFAPWLTGEKLTDASTGQEIAATIPQATITLSNPRVAQDVYVGSLSDYLGFKMKDPTAPNTAYQKPVNIFPYLCYHWIWDNMYRNSRVQRRAFSQPSSYGAPFTSSVWASYLPYIHTSRTVSIGGHGTDETMADGKFLCELRQRNFDADYFTNMTNNPQSVSNPAAVSFQVDGSGNGSFTIAALRAQNSLQIYLERQNLAGFRLTEFVKANYGVNLHEGVAQMPVFLGRMSSDVYSKGVDTSAETSGITNNNPFAGTVGARYGSAYALGNDSLVDEFEAKEPGIIMVITSLVPKVTYATGIDPLLKHYIGQSSQGSVANPLLQNVGQQAVFVDELSSEPSASPAIFGFTDRFSEFMTKVDRVSGLFKDGESLQSFVLQRSFSTPPSLSSSFLEIPTTYLDQVTAVTATVSQFGFWVDMFFEFKIVQPLHQYSIPSLQDPAYEHGKGVIINRSAQVVN